MISVAAAIRKLLILDLDGTLWGGYAATEIIFGVKDGTEGTAFQNFQQYVKVMQKCGVMLAVCSLNDDAVARRPFTDRQMPLQLSDFSSFRANWNDKVDNIISIGRELKIKTHEMVFVDNCPNQRENVRNCLPKVAVPELPDDPGRYIETLKAGRWFTCY